MPRHGRRITVLYSRAGKVSILLELVFPTISDHATMRSPKHSAGGARQRVVFLCGSGSISKRKGYGPELVIAPLAVVFLGAEYLSV